MSYLSEKIEGARAFIRQKLSDVNRTITGKAKQKSVLSCRDSKNRRPLRIPRYVAMVLPLFVFILSSAVQAADGTLNYATSGSGKYKASVGLLDWAGTALDNGIQNGDSVDFPISGCNTGTLNATFSNVSNAANGATYKPTDMKTWKGASMWQAYNGPGSGEALYGGDNADVSFTVNWSMTLDGTVVNPSVLLLDAEATNLGTGEFISGTTNGQPWRLVDNAVGTDYIVSGIGTQTFSFTKSESPSHSAMLVSVDASQTDVDINGGGKQGIAFAILLSCDYGDANGYASASHAFIKEPASPSGLQNAAGQPYLGTGPDSEIAQQDSATALGDDNDSLGDDETGISAFPALVVGQSSYTLPAANITASGDATLYAWIDFDNSEPSPI